jgi:hypothetical protein
LLLPDLRVGDLDGLKFRRAAQGGERGPVSTGTIPLARSWGTRSCSSGRRDCRERGLP